MLGKVRENILFCTYWPVIIFGLSDLLLALDGPDGRALPKAPLELLTFTKVHPLEKKQQHKNTRMSRLIPHSAECPSCWPRMVQRAGSSLIRDTIIIGRRKRRWIIEQTTATQEGDVGEKLKTSSEKAEVIRVQAGVNQCNSKKCYKQQRPWGPETEWWEPLFTGRNAVSTGRLGRMELDEFIKRSAVSPSCHPSPCSQTPINVRNTSKTTFSTRPRKQGYI